MNSKPLLSVGGVSGVEEGDGKNGRSEVVDALVAELETGVEDALVLLIVEADAGSVLVPVLVLLSLVDCELEVDVESVACRAFNASRVA